LGVSIGCCGSLASKNQFTTEVCLSELLNHSLLCQHLVPL
jgi:hypothetical protein